tara:strand:+ start:425 stop:679 length:255 start_codon:yes stop_codon:yes gene_type:complete
MSKVNKKLTEEEISELNKIQQKNLRVIQQFGQIQVSRLNIDKEEEFAEQDLYIVRKEENELVQKLEKKYGKGSVDISTGEFIPA